MTSPVKRRKKRARKPSNNLYVEIEGDGLARLRGYYLIGLPGAIKLHRWLTRYIAWAKEQKR